MVKIGDIELGHFPLLLAPMEDISDPPFRAVCKDCGVDLMFTEFVSAEGLIRDAKQSLQKLEVFDSERPVGIQIFGENIESMKKAASIAEQSNPSLIDINFGCPVKNVVSRGAGAGILLDLDKMQVLAKTVVDSVKLPVTVKTRLGWDENSIKIREVVLRLQDVGVQAISIHARTRTQLYKGKAQWEYIAEVKDDPKVTIPIFGNGDIDSAQKAIDFKNQYGVDGIMIGRAAIGNPWIFSDIKALRNGKKLEILKQKKIDTILKHLALSIKWKGEAIGVMEMRRHYHNYFKHLDLPKEKKHDILTAKQSDQIVHLLTTVQYEF